MAKKKTRSRKTALKHAPTDHARNYSEIAYRYAEQAVKDNSVTYFDDEGVKKTKGKTHCKWVRLAAKRHLDDLKKQRRRDYLFKFDPWHGNDICDFIEKLPHIEGQWDTNTITLEPAQIFFLVVIFGWRRKSNMRRRFTSVYIEMARKGAKSTLTAAVALYCLSCEEETGPQVLIAATTGDQAQKVFRPAKRMVEKTPDLIEAFSLTAWAKSITCEENGGYIQPINAKSSTQDGHNPHVGILDELHAHKDRGLYDVIKSAFGSRKNPLMWVITTAGYIIDGVCYEQRTLVTKILSGLIEADHYFGIIYTLDEQDNEFDPEVWIKPNPMIGVTPTLESMESYAIEAKESPDSNFEFKTKRLNIWTTAKGAWLSTEAWRRCNGPVNLDKLQSEPCYGGLDLASVEDIAAFVLSWRYRNRLYWHPRFYVPETKIKPRTEKANIPYQTWHDQGFLTATPGNVIDYAFIEKDIIDSLDQYDIRQIGFDSWNASDLTNRLIEQNAPMIEFRQGTKSYHPPMQELLRNIKAGTLNHDGNPVLAWMASNLVKREDVNENMAPDRKNSQEKIDGMVAGLMALGVTMVNEDQTFDDDYELTVV
jgi:phage terminase large subunit-like protein